jgi:esterase/lipase
MGERGPGTGVLRRTLRRLAVALAVLLLALLALALWPVDLDGLDVAHEPPTTSSGHAQARFEAWAGSEDEENVFPPCRSELHGPGERTEVVVVLLHGLTNCPRQLVEVAEALADDGMNVVVLRAPHHGVATPDGSAIGDVSLVQDLTAEDLVGWADASVDVAAGLGEEVRVLGFSMGGATAAWVAQHREVDRAVLVAPAMSLPGMPGVVDAAFPNLFSRLPHVGVPGDATLDHAYAGESTTAAAEMFRLGRAVRRAASEQPPATREIHVITNEADDQVDNDDIAALVDDWRDHGAEVTTESFAAELALPHDVIDAGEPEGRTDLTWPVVLDALR